MGASVSLRLSSSTQNGIEPRTCTIDGAWQKDHWTDACTDDGGLQPHATARPEAIPPIGDDVNGKEQKPCLTAENTQAYGMIPEYEKLLGNMRMQPLSRFGRREHFSRLPNANKQLLLQLRLAIDATQRRSSSRIQLAAQPIARGDVRVTCL